MYTHNTLPASVQVVVVEVHSPPEIRILQMTMQQKQIFQTLCHLHFYKNDCFATVQIIINQTEDQEGAQRSKEQRWHHQEEHNKLLNIKAK